MRGEMVHCGEVREEVEGEERTESKWTKRGTEDQGSEWPKQQVYVGKKLEEEKPSLWAREI